jgi:predicted dehydrogenase
MPSANEPVRLIQAGAGSMGQAWLRVIKANPDVRLVGLADLNLDAARRSAEGFDGVAVAPTVNELIDTVEADAVVNVTVPAAHAEVSTVALLAGLAVLCEKPVAESTAGALSMAAAAEVGDRLLMVSQSRRYFRQLDALRGQVARLGRLGIVECTFFKGPHFGGFRDEMEYPLLNDMAIHQFDLSRDLIGAEPEWISCESVNPAWSWYAGDAAAQVAAGFTDGTRFWFSGSWASPGMETSWNGRWRISGSDGTALWDGDGEPVAQDAGGAFIPAVPGTGLEEIGGSLTEFVAALRGGPAPDTEIHGNVMSLLMVEGAIRSARTGSRVVLADLLDEAYRAAIEAETRPQLRAALESWPSVHEVIGAAVARERA